MRWLTDATVSWGTALRGFRFRLVRVKASGTTTVSGAAAMSYNFLFAAIPLIRSASRPPAFRCSTRSGRFRTSSACCRVARFPPGLDDSCNTRNLTTFGIVALAVRRDPPTRSRRC